MTRAYITRHLIKNHVFWKKHTLLVNSFLIILFTIFSHLAFESSSWLPGFHSVQGLIITLGKPWGAGKLTLNLKQVLKQKARFILLSFCSVLIWVTYKIMILFLIVKLFWYVGFILFHMGNLSRIARLSRTQSLSSW